MGKTAEESRKLPLNLITALNDEDAAEGKFFVEDSSQTVKFAIKGKSLEISDVRDCSSISTGHQFSISNIHLYTQTVQHCNVNKKFCVEKGGNFVLNFISSCIVSMS